MVFNAATESARRRWGVDSEVPDVIAFNFSRRDLCRSVEAALVGMMSFSCLAVILAGERSSDPSGD